MVIAKTRLAGVACGMCCVALAAALVGCSSAKTVVYGDTAASQSALTVTDAMGKDIESAAVRDAGSQDSYAQLSGAQVICAAGDQVSLNIAQNTPVDVRITCTDGSYYELHNVDAGSLNSQVSLCYDRSLDMAYLTYEDGSGNQASTLDAEQDYLAKHEAQLKKEAADQKAASKVAAKIAGIGKVTLGKEKAITAAKKAYGKLTKEQKGLVDNYKTLKKAQKQLAKLKKEKEKAEAAAAAAAQQSSTSGSYSDSSSNGSSSSGTSSSGGKSSGKTSGGSGSGSHSSGGSSSGGSGSSGGSSSGGSSGGSGDSGSDSSACDPDAF